MADESTNEIVVNVRDNGPYLIAGAVKVLDAEGNPLAFQGTTVALCRCGQSGNKPFCDGTHRGASFDSAPRAAVE
jgi:CDGSH-type Zn-finger protein